jgi:hypothetical protein
MEYPHLGGQSQDRKHGFRYARCHSRSVPPAQVRADKGARNPLAWVGGGQVDGGGRRRAVVVARRRWCPVPA